MFSNFNKRKKPSDETRPKQHSTGDLSISSTESLVIGGAGGMREGVKEGLGASSADMSPARILGLRVQFQVYYLGSVPNLCISESGKRDTEAHLIDLVEEAQLEERLPLSAQDKDIVLLNISRHGIKVLDSARQEVMQRYPLHTVSQILYYDDGFGKTNVALKIGQVGKTVFQCCVFQCHSEDQAVAICQSLKQLFDAITQKS